MQVDNAVVLYNVAQVITTHDLQQLFSTQTSVAASARKLVSNKAFWKHKFERLVNVCFDDHRPGKTSWRLKCLMYERAGLAGLLLSSEVMDISIAYTAMHKDAVEKIFDAAFITAQALQDGDEVRIRYLSARKEFDFHYLAGMVLTGTLYLSEEDNPVPSPALSPQVIDLLLSPEIGVKLGEHECGPDAMKWAIKSNNKDVVEYLSTRAEVRLAERSYEYMLQCVFIDRWDILECLLSHVDVVVNSDIVEELYMHADGADFRDILDLLMSHPRTKQYLE